MHILFLIHYHALSMATPAGPAARSHPPSQARQVRASQHQRVQCLLLHAGALIGRAHASDASKCGVSGRGWDPACLVHFACMLKNGDMLNARPAGEPGHTRDVLLHQAPAISHRPGVRLQGKQPLSSAAPVAWLLFQQLCWPSLSIIIRICCFRLEMQVRADTACTCRT